MSTVDTLQRIKMELDTTFTQIDSLFDLPHDLRQFQPSSDQWTIDEILEHITLTNHYLLITLRESLKKVLRRVREQPLPTEPSNLDRILQISDPDAFAWIRPEHMEPTRRVSSAQVRATMHTQYGECLIILSQTMGGRPVTQGAHVCAKPRQVRYVRVDIFSYSTRAPSLYRNRTASHTIFATINTTLDILKFS